MKIAKEMRKRWGLTFSLALFVFLVMMGAFFLSGVIAVILHAGGLLTFPVGEMAGRRGDPFFALFILIAFCLLLGTTLTVFFSNKALKPIRRVIDATRRVAAGDFSVRVDIKGIYELEELSSSFNKMAQELSSIETLRSGFVNDFSHEFRTPIVSLRGFAKLLKDDNLTKAEREEYLNVIISEAERLAALSTNVLNLSKYENIEIIPNKFPYRLDEQIRRAVVMMEPKWSAKDIEMDVEMDEIIFEGNEDLTQQIWLNLLDNAVKFSNQGGTIRVTLVKVPQGVQFVIADGGLGMDQATVARIFDKFYQRDPSRAQAGNGLGLAIMKRIVDLCHGWIDVRSEPGRGSEFTVFLPGNE